MVANVSFHRIPFLFPLNTGSSSVFHFLALFSFLYILSSSRFYLSQPWLPDDFQLYLQSKPLSRALDPSIHLHRHLHLYIPRHFKIQIVQVLACSLGSETLELFLTPTPSTTPSIPNNHQDLPLLLPKSQILYLFPLIHSGPSINIC